MSPKQKCHQKANVTKMLISPIELIFVFLYLPNELGKIRSPDLVHINPNGLPGHGLSDSTPDLFINVKLLPDVVFLISEVRKVTKTCPAESCLCIVQGLF